MVKTAKSYVVRFIYKGYFVNLIFASCNRLNSKSNYIDGCKAICRYKGDSDEDFNIIFIKRNKN